MHDHTNAIGVLVFFGAACLAYLLPSFIAYFRKHPSVNSITVVNLFLGWSLIGWVIALAWSFSAIPQKA